MAEMLPPLIVGIQLDIAKLKQQGDQVQNQLKQIGNNAKNGAGGLNTMGASVKRLAGQFGLLLGAAQVINFLKQSGRAAVDEQKSFGLLAIALKNVTGATLEQATAIDKQITKMALLAGTTDDSLRPAYQIFLRATKDSQRSLSMLALAQDVAAGTGRNLTGVSQMLSRALTGNLGALNRLVPGIKDAKDPIATLQQYFGGAAKAAADLDPYARMSAAMDEIKEKVGSALLPFLQKFADWLTALVPKVEEFFKALTDPTTEIGKKWKDFSDALVGSAKFLWENLELIKNIVIFLGALKIATVVYNGVLTIMAIKTGIATAAQVGLNIAMSANPIAALITLVLALAAAFVVLAGDARRANDEMYAATGLEAGQIKGRVWAAPGYAGRNAPNSQGSQGSIRALDNALSKTLAPPTPTPTPTPTANAGAKQVADMKKYLTETRVKVVEEQKKYAQAVTEAYANNDKALREAAKSRNDELAALEKEHARAVADITKSFTATLTGIVQDSMNRLRDAFASVASIDVGQMFADSMGNGTLGTTVTTQMKDGIKSAVSWWGNPSSGGGLTGLIDTLRTRLAASQDLIKNAAALSGAGFSQTFIEQVVAQGGEIGNTMAAQVLAATPETQKELQDLFAQTENTANSGMDALAKTIYEKNGLATNELKKLYKTTQEEMTQAFADQQTAYVEQTKAINDAYSKALAEANSALVASLNTAGNALNTSLDAIEKAMTTKLGTMKGKLKPLQSAIGSLRNLLGGSYVEATPESTMSFANAAGAAAGTLGNKVTNINTTINGTNLSSPGQTATDVSNAIKYNVPYLVSVAV
jgi:hypothetical protein